MLEDNTAVEHPAPTSAGTGRTLPRVRVDLMGVPMGFAAVAQCWSAARRSLPELPVWSVNLWWLSSAAVAAVMAALCIQDLRRNSSLENEAHDPTVGPF